jgi:hypothetical protein
VIGRESEREREREMMNMMMIVDEGCITIKSKKVVSD